MQYGLWWHPYGMGDCDGRLTTEDRHLIAAAAAVLILMLCGCSTNGPQSAAEATSSSTRPILPPMPTLSPVSVPHVTGTTFQAANLSLARVNLAPGFTIVDSDTVNPGLVVSQDPAAGSVAAAFSILTLTVSDGPAHPLVGPNCQPGNLRLDLGERVSEATGQHTADLILTNIIGSTCNLFGYPTITLFDSRGKVLPFEYSHQGDQMTTSAQPRVVSLRPGWAAYVRINKYRCDIAAESNTATLRLGYPSPSLGLSFYGGFDYCVEAPSLVVAVSPFQPTALTLYPQ